ncbi:hypothetical protein K438DRAFT_1860956, partial [Mycena galopus ATCC 62051]
MDDGAPLLETFTSAVSESNLPHDAGAFFPHARHFTISGGTYTSNVTQVAPTVRHDFRMIPLGDLDLLHEIRLEDGPSMITRRRSTGKLYHVRLDGRVSPMTAVVYQGEEGEQAWRRALQTYSGIRHPNIVQIYGVVNSRGLYATIFHDEFISLLQYCYDLIQYDFFEKAPLTVFYLSYCLAPNYVLSSQGYELKVRSTGGLAIEILSEGGEEGFADNILGFPKHHIPCHRARVGINSDSIIVSFLDFQDFYDIFPVFSHKDFFYLDSGDRSVQLGAFIRIPDSGRVDELDQLAWVPNRKLLDDGWRCGQSGGIPMQNGWTHFESSEISDLSVSRCLRFGGDSLEHHVWLSQANHIWSHLQITDDYEKYGWVNRIDFTLHFPQSLPNGYLFLCLFQGAKAHTYWSHDPSGTPRLSLAESINCGFPVPQLKLRVSICSLKWTQYPSQPYLALRRFHLAKGFDPDSQDVAIHLGYPLYQICPRPELLFAHVDSQKTNTTAAETHLTLPRFSKSIILTVLGIGVLVLC